MSKYLLYAKDRFMTIPFPKIYLNYNFNGENLLIKLAYEHHCDEVNFLIREGSNIKDAIYGYAWGGHFEEVEHLYKENPELIPFAVAGYCRGGFSDKIMLLISSYKDMEEEIKKNAVYGYAQAGNKRQVLMALKSSKYILMAILGAASTNQKEWLTDLLTGSKYYSQVIQEAAKNGHFSLYKDLINSLGIQIHPSFTVNQMKVDCLKYMNIALKGCINGGHLEEAAHVISLGANPAYAVTELITEGTITQEDATLLLAHINSDEIRKKVLSIILNTDQQLNSELLDEQEILQLNFKIFNGNNYFESIIADEIVNTLNPYAALTVQTLKQIIVRDQQDHLSQKMK